MTDSRRYLGILLMAFFLFGGCQESGRRIDRRAQLVGQENLQLKKQLQEKDRQIEQLKNEIKSLEEKAQKDEELHGQTYTKMMDIIADITAQLEACKAGQPAKEDSTGTP
jgi:predicted RNase H-like nuclease (RuvC/YqgF family)